MLSLSLLGSGCSKDLVVEDFSKIEKGMTLDEVVSLLGEGSEVAAADVESLVGKFEKMEMSEAACDNWKKWGNRKAMGYVGFKDGKVTEMILD
jgi:hypothetical protein